MAEEKKGKPPAFQFYVMDFMTDADGLTSTSNGIWIRMLCKLHRAPNRGEITTTVKAWCRKCNCSEDELMQFINENEDEEIANLTLTDGKLTVISRRMLRERKEREQANIRQKRYEEKKRKEETLTDPDENLTPPSSSSSSSSSSNIKTFIVEKEIFDYWNSMENLITHREFTKAFASCLHSQLKTYSKEEITDAIESYDDILGDPEYLLEYKWKIDEFLKRKLEQFVADAKPHDFQPRKAGNKR